MKRLIAVILIGLTLACVLSCSSTIKKVRSSLVTVKISGRTAMLDIRPATPFEKMRRFLGRALSPASADAAIPTIVQVLRLTVSAPDMNTIIATVPVAGLSSVDFLIEVPNGPQRHFVVEGLDSASTAQYTGEAYSDLIGDPVLLTINMAPVSLADTIAPLFAGLTLVTNVTPSSMTLSWAAASDNVTSAANMVYYIYVATTTGGENFTAPNYSSAPGATSFPVPGLAQGTPYFFIVRARDEAGNIDGNTVEMSSTLPDTVSPAFAGLNLVTNISATSVQLSWAPATDNVTPQSGIVYIVYQGTSPSGEVYTAPAFTTAPGAASAIISGLTQSVTYYFVVQAMDSAGNIDTNTIERSSTLPDTLAPTFAGLSLISNITTSTMLLSWPAATDNVTPQPNIVYLIYQATTPGGENFASPTYATAPGATSYQINGLTLGNTYYFIVRARDAAGNVDGNTVQMIGYYPGTYVNVNTGLDLTGCGTPANPCQTITFALSLPTVTAGNSNILVAPGIYSSSSVTAPETFPLPLPTGTSLFCYGANFSTVIDDSAGLSTSGIIINDPNALGGTLIDGCFVYTVTNAAAVNDSLLPMTVVNCSVNSNGSLNSVTGIQLSANSIVLNSTIAGFSGGDGSGAGIRVSQNALISGNTITGNYYGVYISSGTPIISGNTITANFNGLNIIDGSPTINNNTITNNSNSGITSSGTPSTSPTIIANDISSNAYGIQTISQGTWTISGNTINNSTFTGIWIDNTFSLQSVFGTISGNIISNSTNTTAYGIQIRPTNNVVMSVTGNTINGNGIGIDVSTNASTVTLPTINNNNLFCNNTADLNTSTLTVIDATSNAWDHAPPTLASSAATACPAGTDWCYLGSTPNPSDYASYTLAPPCP